MPMPASEEDVDTAVDLEGQLMTERQFCLVQYAP